VIREALLRSNDRVMCHLHRGPPRITVSRVRDVSNNACNTGKNRRLRTYRRGGQEYSPDVNSLNRPDAIGVVPRAALKDKGKKKKKKQQHSEASKVASR